VGETQLGAGRRKLKVEAPAAGVDADLVGIDQVPAAGAIRVQAFGQRAQRRRGARLSRRLERQMCAGRSPDTWCRRRMRLGD
jgi:hypothetical protein